MSGSGLSERTVDGLQCTFADQASGVSSGYESIYLGIYYDMYEAGFLLWSRETGRRGGFPLRRDARPDADRCDRDRYRARCEIACTWSRFFFFARGFVAWGWRVSRTVGGEGEGEGMMGGAYAHLPVHLAWYRGRLLAMMCCGAVVLRVPPPKRPHFLEGFPACACVREAFPSKRRRGVAVVTLRSCSSSSSPPAATRTEKTTGKRDVTSRGFRRRRARAKSGFRGKKGPTLPCHAGADPSIIRRRRIRESISGWGRGGEGGP